MSGIATATGIAGGTILAGIGAAASAASAIYSITAKGATASGASQESQVSASENQALTARSMLLETAGGSAGSPLAPGDVGKNPNTIFGN